MHIFNFPCLDQYNVQLLCIISMPEPFPPNKYDVHPDPPSCYILSSLPSVWWGVHLILRLSTDPISLTIYHSQRFTEAFYKIKLRFVWKRFLLYFQSSYPEILANQRRYFPLTSRSIYCNEKKIYRLTKMLKVHFMWLLLWSSPPHTCLKIQQQRQAVSVECVQYRG